MGNVEMLMDEGKEWIRKEGSWKGREPCKLGRRLARDLQGVT